MTLSLPRALSLLAAGSVLFLSGCSGVHVRKSAPITSTSPSMSSPDTTYRSVDTESNETSSIDSQSTSSTDTTTVPTGDLPLDGTDDAATFVQTSVDSTLAANSYTLSNTLSLNIGTQNVSLAARGSVDYPNAISDLAIHVESSTAPNQDLDLRADGVNFWLRANNTNGKWAEVDVSRMTESKVFEPESFLGVLYMLRAANDVTVGEESTIDGVTGREYTTTFTYIEAAEAAGPDKQAFTTSFSLTGVGVSAPLAVKVWIGDDNVVRTFHFDIVDNGLISGNGDVTLTNVNGAVSAPVAPPADETVTGPEAEQLVSGFTD